MSSSRQDPAPSCITASAARAARRCNLGAVGTDASERPHGGKVIQAHARNNRRDDGAHDRQKHDGQEVSEEVALIERVARLEQYRGHQVQEKDGVKVLAGPGSSRAQGQRRGEADDKGQDALGTLPRRRLHPLRT